jgi:hypothetical protein
MQIRMYSRARWVNGLPVPVILLMTQAAFAQHCQEVIPSAGSIGPFTVNGSNIGTTIEPDGTQVGPTTTPYSFVKSWSGPADFMSGAGIAGTQQTDMFQVCNPSQPYSTSSRESYIVNALGGSWHVSQTANVSNGVVTVTQQNTLNTTQGDTAYPAGCAGVGTGAVCTYMNQTWTITLTYTVATGAYSLSETGIDYNNYILPDGTQQQNIGTWSFSTTGVWPVTHGIQITLVSPPPTNQYLITDTPTMPTISATAQIIGISPDPTPTTVFTWTVNLSVAENGSTGNTIYYGCPVSIAGCNNSIYQNVTTTGTEPYTLQFYDPGIAAPFFRGGDLTLFVSATLPNGQTVSAQTPTDLNPDIPPYLLEIDGTNPQRSTVQNYIIGQVPSRTWVKLNNGDVADVLQRIACEESGPNGQVQFDGAANGGTGLPLVASDNGIGIMQITQSSPDLFVSQPNVVFDWQSNISLGVGVYQQKVKSFAFPYPGELAMDDDPNDTDSYISYINTYINPTRKANQLPPITTPPAPSYTTTGPIGSNPPNQLLEDAVRFYNGPGANPDPLGFKYLHEFMPNFNFLMTATSAQLTSSQVWLRVCSTTPGNGLLYGPYEYDDCSDPDARGAPNSKGVVPGDPSYVNNVAANVAQCPNGSQRN